MKILMANRPGDGKAVWLAPDHSWTKDMEAAEIALDLVCIEKLERAGKAALLKNEVVNVALVDIDLAGSEIAPKLPCPRAGPACHANPPRHAADAA